MNMTDYTTPSAKIVEMITEGVLCFSLGVPGSNDDYFEKEFEW